MASALLKLKNEYLPCHQHRHASFFDVLCFGICAVIGSHFDLWNHGLSCGFWPFFYIVIIIGSCYFTMVLCIQEMSSALPFSGGAYGFVRVSLGNYAGFIIGVSETFQYVVIVAFTIYKMGDIFFLITDYENKYAPLVWFVLYCLLSIILFFERYLFWNSIRVFAVYIGVLVIVYCIMIPLDKKSDFGLYSKFIEYYDPPSENPTYDFFVSMPQAAWLFGAVKTIPIVNSVSVLPHKTVPQSMYAIYCCALASAFGLLFCSVSLYPGISLVYRNPFPTLLGFIEIFSLTTKHALAIIMVQQFSICLTFSYAFARQVDALDKSGFQMPLGRLAQQYFPRIDSIFLSFIIGSLHGFILVYILWEEYEDYFEYIKNGCLLCGFTVNISILLSYLDFRRCFSSILKSYRSPLGYVGALLAILGFILIFCCVAGFQADEYKALIVFAVFMTVQTLLYFLFYRNKQKHSAEESSVLFIAYVIKTNRNRRARRSKRGKDLRGTIRNSTFLDALSDSIPAKTAVSSVNVSKTISEKDLGLPIEAVGEGISIARFAKEVVGTDTVSSSSNMMVYSFDHDEFGTDAVEEVLTVDEPRANMQSHTVVPVTSTKVLSSELREKKIRSANEQINTVFVEGFQFERPALLNLTTEFEEYYDCDSEAYSVHSVGDFS